MKLKLIYEMLKSLSDSVNKKVAKESEMDSLPQENKEYTKGQAYELQYILARVEEIIFKDND